jgi:metal-sulfur cluster biosynthetic enzyme
MNGKPDENDDKLQEISNEDILDVLRSVQDPEIGIGIVDLGLIYGVEINEGGKVKIEMTLTAMGCPYGETLVSQVRQEAVKVEGVSDAIVNLVWNPPWNPEQMCTDSAKDKLGIW